MEYSIEKMQEFVALLEQHTPQEGLNETSIPELVTYKESQPQGACAQVYATGIAILGQGKKHCTVDGYTYDYSAGNYLSVFLPMPIDVVVVEATPEKPLLMAGIKLDLARIASLLVKMDRVESPQPASKPIESSAILSRPMNDDLLHAIVKLMRALDNPLEREVLGYSILDEIYFRVIMGDQTGSVPELLQHRGQVQQISRAVEHIHRNIDEVVSVDELAGMVNMSSSGFRKRFREVMHMPPLQYAKAIKLDRAQILIRQGRNASEAAYLVGYNSPAQFSREYKRHFGYSPSSTMTAV